MAVMTYEAFVTTVQQGAHISSAEAQRAACATIQTLTERISARESEDIGDRLPDRLRSCVTTADGGAAFQAGEFLRRVAERAELDEAAAERDARAVLSALFRAVGPEEFYDLRAELPDDFDPLLDEAMRDASTLVTGETEARPGMSTEQFVERVADRADVDPERARHAVNTVLGVLAMRITLGQLEDLAARLPPELRAALERGRAESGRLRPLSAVEFLREVARRDDVSMDEAADRVRSVLTTLRESVGEQEFEHTAHQLPDEYAPLLRYQG
jgi:uncharacterized protein (DUF2267 family)